MQKKSKIVLCGSSGFIGSYLLEALRNEGYIVYEVDKKNSKEQNILNINSNFFKWLSSVVDKNTIVIQAAAIARVRDSVISPILAMENINILYNVTEWARQNKITKILFTSSRETYGNADIKNYTEIEARHYNAESPYAMSKLCGEAMIIAWNKCFNMRGIIVRLSNVFGHHDPNDRFIPRMFKLIPKNKPVEIYGKNKEMDFTYIDDCVSGILTAVKNYDKLSKQELPIFNIASGKSAKLWDVAKYIKEKCNSKSPIKLLKNHIGEVVYYRADISR
ncbi:MAG: NAD-dependent epimerase/dehydratase family protein, partial [Nanoarchaeota archaeon]